MQPTLAATVTLFALLAASATALAETPADSALLDQGDSFTVTFNEIGEFAYHCHPHPYMTASVVVSEDPDASSGDVQVVMRDFAFAPATIKVRPGTNVTWTNEDPAPHTVTFERESESHGHDSAGDHDMHGNDTDMDDHMGNESGDDMGDHSGNAGHAGNESMGDGTSTHGSSHDSTQGSTPDDGAPPTTSVPSPAPILAAVAAGAVALATRRLR